MKHGHHHPAARREHERFLVDLPLSIWDSSHHLVDSKAVAHDVTTHGFGFETKGEVGQLIRVYFELRLPDGQSVSGAARVAWNRKSEWGYWGGARIMELSASDRRKIHQAIHGPGYDWHAFGDRALIAGALVVGGLVLQDLLSRRSDALLAVPWVLMAALLAAVLYFHLGDR